MYQMAEFYVTASTRRATDAAPKKLPLIAKNKRKYADADGR